MANAMLDAGPMWLSRRAADALDDALTCTRDTFERTLAVLREENSTLRRLFEAAAARADQLALELTKAVVIQPTPRPLAAVPPRRTSREPVPGVGNVLDPVTLGDPAGMFDTVAAASLMAAEDDASAA